LGNVEVEIPGQEVNEGANGIKSELKQQGDGELRAAVEEGGSIFNGGEGTDLMEKSDFDVAL
jgi:hypothetical protein